MNKQKLIGAILGVVLFIAAITGLTYAYISWTSDDMNKVVSSKCFNVLYEKGNDFTGDLMPSDDYTGGISVEVKMDIDKSCNIDANGKLYLHIDENTSEKLFTEGILNYQVLINGKLTNLKGNITSSGDIVLDVGLLNSNASASTIYKIYVWINKYYINNEHANLSFAGSVGSEAVQVTKQPSKNLLNHLTSLYTGGNPTLITHSKSDETSDTYYYSYQDIEQTWGLMNDGLKVDNTLDATTTGLATTVTDTTALTNGTEGNIRYFGPSDKVNNYIYFNCDDYNNQSDTTCEKWRIIGIVDGKVKIIKDETESIGRLAWDQDKNQDSSLTTYSNNWETSSLQLFLNGVYYNRGSSTSYEYFSEQDGSFKKTLQLQDIGITASTRNNNLISSSTWYLGGYSSSDLYSNDIYNYERTNIVGTTIYDTNPFTINANIGLIYASDYGYATDLTKCSDNINNYNSDMCSTNNWLLSATQWLITPHPKNSWNAGNILSDGIAVFTRSIFRAYVWVRPTLYLNTDVLINKGSGTNTNPYRIVVE